MNPNSVVGKPYSEVKDALEAEAKSSGAVVELVQLPLQDLPVSRKAESQSVDDESDPGKFYDAIESGMTGKMATTYDISANAAYVDGHRTLVVRIQDG